MKIKNMLKIIKRNKKLEVDFEPKMFALPFAFIFEEYYEFNKIQIGFLWFWLVLEFKQ